MSDSEAAQRANGKAGPEESRIWAGSLSLNQLLSGQPFVIMGSNCPETDLAIVRRKEEADNLTFIFKGDYMEAYSGVILQNYAFRAVVAQIAACYGGGLI